jgi:hypothetical protein
MSILVILHALYMKVIDSRYVDYISFKIIETSLLENLES